MFMILPSFAQLVLNYDIGYFSQYKWTHSTSLESQNQAKLGNNISATGRYNFSFLIVKGSKSHPLRATLYDIHSQYEYM